MDDDRGLDGHLLRRDELPNQELFAEECQGSVCLEFLPMVVEGAAECRLVSMSGWLESLPVGIEHLDMDISSFSGS